MEICKNIVFEVFSSSFSLEESILSQKGEMGVSVRFTDKLGNWKSDSFPVYLYFSTGPSLNSGLPTLVKMKVLNSARKGLSFQKV